MKTSASLEEWTQNDLFSILQLPALWHMDSTHCFLCWMQGKKCTLNTSQFFGRKLHTQSLLGNANSYEANENSGHICKAECSCIWIFSLMLCKPNGLNFSLNIFVVMQQDLPAANISLNILKDLHLSRPLNIRLSWWGERVSYRT